MLEKEKQQFKNWIIEEHHSQHNRDLLNQREHFQKIISDLKYE